MQDLQNSHAVICDSNVDIGVYTGVQHSPRTKRRCRAPPDKFEILGGRHIVQNAALVSCSQMDAWMM